MFRLNGILEYRPDPMNMAVDIVAAVAQIPENGGGLKQSQEQDRDRFRFNVPPDPPALLPQPDNGLHPGEEGFD